MGGARYCICDTFVLWAHADSSKGSSHATFLASSFIPQTPSLLLRPPAEDAGDPIPWRQAVCAA